MATARQLRNLRQQVTWWPTSAPKFAGFTFGTPTLLKARWEDRQELFRKPGGEELVSKAVVFLADDVSIGDYMALGDYTTTDDPTTLQGAFRVEQFSKITSLRNTEVERRAFL